jgi:primosomal protein N' (replication factor Y)
VRAVAGTRAAAYAPVADPGLFVVWDDGDDLHREPRAPYPDTRDVLALRSSHTGAALLIGGHVRSTQSQQLLDSGWAHAIVAERATVRESAPRILATGDDFELERDPAARAARLPSLAWRTARAALADGAPVLVQVARSGYVPALACARDRTAAHCRHCSGPLRLAGTAATPTCAWCGRPATGWQCPTCGESRLRAITVGARRTAEELGRAFPGTLVRGSGGEHVLDRVDGQPAIVVATAGAEPPADGGYGAALLLDANALLARQDLRAGEEALRRWMNAAALVRSGAPVVITADASVPVVQALVRWDPAGFAGRELAERTELRLPPAARLAALTGAPNAVAELVELAHLPQPHEVIGPVPTGDDQHRLLVRVGREAGGALALALHQAAGIRSARKAPDPVKVVLDPVELF